MSGLQTVALVKVLERIATALEAQRTHSHLQCGARLGRSRCSLAAGHGGDNHANFDQCEPLTWPATVSWRAAIDLRRVGANATRKAAESSAEFAAALATV